MAMRLVPPLGYWWSPAVVWNESPSLGAPIIQLIWGNSSMLCKRLSVAMVRDPWQPFLTLPPPSPCAILFLSSHTGTLGALERQTDSETGNESCGGGGPSSVHLNKLFTSPTVHLPLNRSQISVYDARLHWLWLTNSRGGWSESSCASGDSLTDSLLLKCKIEQKRSNTLHTHDFICRKNGC